MILLRWSALIVSSFVIDLLGLFVVPFAIALSDGKTLPAWASWWDNDVEPLGDSDRKADIDAATGLWRGFLRWRWLCLRNPGNNFGYLCGVVPTGVWKCRGDPNVSDQGRAGWLAVRCDNAFCFYTVKRWGASRCLRVAIGWKIWDLAPSNAQIVCVVNPFMKFIERA